jgi:hypothetical protein
MVNKEKAVVANRNTLSQHCRRRRMKTIRNLNQNSQSVSLIHITYLLNWSQSCYHCVSPLSVCVCVCVCGGGGGVGWMEGLIHRYICLHTVCSDSR